MLLQPRQPPSVSASYVHRLHRYVGGSGKRAGLLVMSEDADLHGDREEFLQILDVTMIGT